MVPPSLKRFSSKDDWNNLVPRLRGDEAPLREPFWMFESASEERAVEVLLRRRFPELFSIIMDSLEQTDPLDVVYPDNPGEYNDVVYEILVLLAPFDDPWNEISDEMIERMVTTGLGRRFGEPPNYSRLRETTRLISDRLKQG
jgi:hypothetical protein